MAERKIAWAREILHAKQHDEGGCVGGREKSEMDIRIKLNIIYLNYFLDLNTLD